MITVTAYNGQKVGIFGLGKAGDSSVPALLAGGAELYLWDDNEASRKAAAERYQGKATLLPVAEWPWQELKALVLSPGVPLTHPKPHESALLAQKHNVSVIGDIELLYQTCPDARYIAITGTNGKSTTTTLIGHILKTAGLKAEVGGNLGTAVLSFEPLGADGTYVIETSSYQLDLLQTVRFNIAALLNVTPDHLDRHGSMEGYVKAKMHVFERQRADDTAVVATDDRYTQDMAAQLQKTGQNIVRVSAEKDADVYVRDGILYDGAFRFDLKPIVTLTGQHNWQNACVAYAVAKAAGVSPAVIYEAMKSFGGLRHRLQLVTSIRGVRFINDSKATNADATSNALAPYENIYWILGGKPKAGGIESLERFFPKIAHAFLIGQAEEEFAATLQGKASVTRCGTLKTAFEKASAMALAEGKKGAVVLLSPACASFDQWKSFEARGDAFCQMAEDLAARGVAA